MDANYSLADLSAVTNGTNGGGSWLLLILFVLLLGGNGAWGNRGEFGQYATAASQQEILFGQRFQNIDNKIDRLGNGIADATFSLNNSIKDGNSMVAGRVVDEGRGIQNQIAQVRYDMANFNSQTASAIHAEGEATRSLLQQNKIDALQSQINQLQLQNAMCGTPKISPYMYGIVPNYCGCNCGCNGTV